MNEFTVKNTHSMSPRLVLSQRLPHFFSVLPEIFYLKVYKCLYVRTHTSHFKDHSSHREKEAFRVIVHEFYNF